MRRIAFKLLAVLAVLLISVPSISAQSKGKHKTAAKKSAARTEQTAPVKSVVVEYEDSVGLAGEIYPVFVEIYNPNEPKCRDFDKVFEQVAAKREGQAEFYRIDLTKYPEAIDWFDIYVLPTLVTIVGEGEGDYHGTIINGSITVERLLRNIDMDIKNWKFYYGR